MPLLSKARSPQRKAVPVGAAGGSERNGCRWEASDRERPTNSQTHDVAGRDQRYRVHDQARLLVSPCMTERVPRFAKQCLECKSLALPFAQLVPILFVVRLLANIVDDACCGRLSELLERQGRGNCLRGRCHVSSPPPLPPPSRRPRVNMRRILEMPLSSGGGLRPAQSSPGCSRAGQPGKTVIGRSLPKGVTAVSLNEVYNHLVRVTPPAPPACALVSSANMI